MLGNKNSSMNSRTVQSHSGSPNNRYNYRTSVKRKLGCTLLACMIGFSSANAATAAKIVIDAGHGGSDPGAIGINGLKEKHVNLDVSMRLHGELLLRGYEVALTRQDDRYISLPDRVMITNEAKADLFVSVHSNSHPSSNISGSQVLYHDSNYPQSDYPASDAMTALTPESKRLAQSVLSHVLLIGKLADKGLVPSAAYVVRMGQIPSILVETAFLSNPQDAAVLADPLMLQKFAVGIANGIQDVLPPTPVPTEFTDIQKHWAKDAVYRLKEIGIIELDMKFYPDRPLTRAELLTMLNRKFAFGQRLLGSPKPGVNLPIFKDLPTTHWAADIMYRAGALEYVDGYPDQTIRPDQAVTRAEAAVLLQRIMLLPKLDKPLTETGFTDVSVDSWAANAIVQLSQKGFINGTGDKLYTPNKVMTRAEMAVLLDRAK